MSISFFKEPYRNTVQVRDDLLAGSEVIMCIVSEGATDTSGHPITPQCVTDVLDKKLSLNTKITVLGHFQVRGQHLIYKYEGA